MASLGFAHGDEEESGETGEGSPVHRGEESDTGPAKKIDTNVDPANLEFHATGARTLTLWRWGRSCEGLAGIFFVLYKGIQI